MNKRQKIKHLQRCNAKHIEARLELSKALNNAIAELKAYKHISQNLAEKLIPLDEACEQLESENNRLKLELNKPLLSRLWRWNK